MKFRTWPLEVRIVAIAWVPAALAAITALVLLKYGMIERTSGAFSLPMLAGSGLTMLLIFELLTWNDFGIGFLEACLRGAMQDQELAAKVKERLSWRNNPLVRRKRR